MVEIQSAAAEIRRGKKLEMWADAQRDGRPAEYGWRPLFNAAVWLCSNAAKMRNLLKFAVLPQTNETIAAEWAEVHHIARICGEILLLNNFFFRLSICALVAKI